MLETLKLVSVEATLSFTLVVSFLIHLFSDDFKKHLSKLILAGLSIAFIETFFLWNHEALLFQNAYALNNFAVFFKAIFAGSGFFVTLMCEEYLTHASPKKNSYEFLMLILTSLIGACTLVSSRNLITFFISIELITISLYILTTYLKTDARSIEAGTKYLIMGAFSSAIMVYGMSLLYGATGSLSFGEIQASVISGTYQHSLFLAGFFMVFSGIGFKISIFPFHLWAPDVYEGAPTPATAFLSIVSKTVGFAALAILLSAGFQGVGHDWTSLTALLAAISLLYGNLGAIPQLEGNIKRLLAFSSIGHAGYLLSALACGSIEGLHALLYYLAVYALSGLSIFLSIIAAHTKDEACRSFKGIFSKSPILGISLFIGFLSLAGVPPLGGFFGKFLVFQSLIESKLYWLAILGSINVVFSLYYYLLMIKMIYTDDSNDHGTIQVRPIVRISLILLSGSLILLGVFQEPFLNLIRQAIN